MLKVWLFGSFLILFYSKDYYWEIFLSLNMFFENHIAGSDRRREFVCSSIKMLDLDFREKLLRAYGGYLGSKRRWRTFVRERYASGSAQARFEPEISEWGNPANRNISDPQMSKVVCEEWTWGTETSKYPEEEKSKEISLVAASEREIGQTSERAHWGCRTCIKKHQGRGSVWEGTPEGVKVPYSKLWQSGGYPE